jgi:hypothetical protein
MYSEVTDCENGNSKSCCCYNKLIDCKHRNIVRYIRLLQFLKCVFNYSYFLKII